MPGKITKHRHYLFLFFETYYYVNIINSGQCQSGSKYYFELLSWMEVDQTLQSLKAAKKGHLCTVRLWPLWSMIHDSTSTLKTLLGNCQRLVFTVREREKSQKWVKNFEHLMICVWRTLTWTLTESYQIELKAKLMSVQHFITGTTPDKPKHVLCYNYS